MRIVFMALVAVSWVACSSSNEDQFQCDCVRDEFVEGSLDRTLPIGAECRNFSIAGCSCFASECIDLCVNQVCQSTECGVDADCASVGAIAECEALEDPDFGPLGRWCDPEPACPKGTAGCPCRDGQCTGSGNGITVNCESATNTCVSNDSCPSGCRAGSVCCGGAFCAGNCIGTPCC